MIEDTTKYSSPMAGDLDDPFAETDIGSFVADERVFSQLRQRDKDMKKLAEEYDELRDENKRLEMEIRELKKLQEKYRMLDDENKTLRETNEILGKKIEELQNLHKEFSKRMDGIDNKEILRLTEENERIVGESERINEDRKKCMKSYGEVWEENERLKKWNEHLEECLFFFVSYIFLGGD
jgi:DNA repair exonuclease SbcCD ATPase subunit